MVDKDAGFVRMVQQALGDFCELSIASTRREALLKVGGKAPILVILGYLEPRGDTFRLHKELKGDPDNNRISLLVVDVCPEEYLRKGWRREEGIQMDAEDYVSRPIKPAELAELVKDILERISPEPLELKSMWKQVEGILKRIDKIEKMLVK